jgi:ABC-type multidrug transport system permease subunit
MHKRSALYELTLARTKEFVREPEAVFWVFAFPILLALALGFAFREKAPDRIAIGVVSGAESAELAAKMNASPALRARIYDDATGREALRTGKISLLVRPGQPLRYEFDPTRPDSRIARLEADDVVQAAAGRKAARATDERRVTERGSRYIDFLIPGLLGMNLMGTGMWGVGFSIVTARTRKLLKRLVATPMRKSDYLLAQILSRLVFLAFEVAVLVSFGWIAFGVAVRGSLLTLLLMCVIGAISFAGIGLLIASRARTVEAVSGLMNVVMMPMWLCSGVFFSSERFPDAAQPFIRLLPLTALNEALRAIILEARPLAQLTPQIAIMLGWGLSCFLVALKIFRWR